MIGRAGEEIKKEMMVVVTLRRELEAVEREWRDLLTILENGEWNESESAIAEAVNRERMQLRRELTRCQLKNWARLSRVPLTPLQRRVLGLRFVQACPWSEIVARVQKAKQYLLREHNKALDAIGAFETARRRKREEEN